MIKETLQKPAVSLIVLLSAGLYLHAEENQQELKPVIVKDTSIAPDTTPSAPAMIMTPAKLETLAQADVGDLLSDLPGISSSYFGPNAGRPIVRGLDGDRVKITQNGTNTLDASSVSPDHAVSVDPLTIKEIQVLRGPAALLYSGSILGGVVNLIDNRIPEELLPNQGTFLTRFGSVDDLRANSILVQGSIGQWAYHLDGFTKTTDNLDTPIGTISDTSSVSNGAGFGVSYIGASSHIGISYSLLNSQYGVADPGTLIDLHQRRWDLAGATDKPFEGIKSISYKLGISDYGHTELDYGVPGTVFSNQGWDSRVDVDLGKHGGLEGVFGVAAGKFDFTVTGDEAFLPVTHSNNEALFGSFTNLLADNSWKLRYGFRLESDRVSADAWDHTGILPSHPADNRSFIPLALSVGLVKDWNPSWQSSLTLSHTERAPNFQELYADGPHLGTNAYEVGNSNLGIERALGLELALNKNQGTVTGSASVYYNHFSSYIAQLQNGFGPNLGYADYSDIPRYDYVSVPADFYGLEAKTQVNLTNTKTEKLQLEFFGDYLRARNSDTGEAIPRISPGRIGTAVNGLLADWTWRVDFTYHFGQYNVASEETPTPGFAMLGANFSHPVKISDANGTFNLKLTNILNSYGQDASSFLKDILPLPGRGIEASLKLTF
jgi:iron complex outermembrane recepter protein